MASNNHRKLLSLAAKQDGIIGVRDALAAGFTRAQFRYVRSSLQWPELQFGTYATFNTRPTWRQLLRAAVIASAPHGVVGGASAASLMRWDGFEKRALVILLPKHVARLLKNVTVHHARDLAPDQLWRVEGFEITNPVRTLVDLAATDASDDALVTALNGLARRGGSSRLQELREQLSAFDSQKTAKLRRLIEERIWRPAFPESFLETRVMRVLKAAGYMPTPQYSVRDGRLEVMRLDAAFVDRKVGIEADSFRHHGGPDPFYSDHAKRNAVRALGWELIGVTDRELAQPENFLRAVQFALSRAAPIQIFKGAMLTTQLSLLDPEPSMPPVTVVQHRYRTHDPASAVVRLADLETLP